MTAPAALPTELTITTQRTGSIPRPDAGALLAPADADPSGSMGRVQARSLLEEMAALPAGLADRVLLPGSTAYETARKPWDPRHHDRFPAAVAYCRTREEVAAIVRWAARLGQRVTPRSGGHCFAGRSSAGDVVVDVSEMDQITVAEGHVEVGAGVRLGNLYATLAGHRLTLPAGCGPSVGVAGLTLGGGLGLLGRRYGLTCDRLLAAEVVLADGRAVRCDSRHHEDLFWALRGAGGGHFGIVTRFVFDPVPEPEVTVFRLGWPPDRAADLAAGWMEWAPAADDRLSAHLELSVPGDPRGSPRVWLTGTMVADPTTTRRAVLELGSRIGAEPVSTTSRQFRYAQAKAVLGEDPADEDRLLEFHRSDFFDDPVSATGVTELVGHLFQDRSAGQARTISLLPMGGAYNRVPAETTAFAHRHHRFLIEHIAGIRPAAPDAEQQAAAAWSAESRQLVDAESATAVYPNFPDADRDGWAQAYWGNNHARLQQIKRRYDPDNVFWARQGLHTGAS